MWNRHIQLFCIFAALWGTGTCCASVKAQSWCFYFEFAKKSVVAILRVCFLKKCHLFIGNSFFLFYWHLKVHSSHFKTSMPSFWFIRWIWEKNSKRLKMNSSCVALLKRNILYEKQPLLQSRYIAEETPTLWKSTISWTDYSFMMLKVSKGEYLDVTQVYSTS